VIAYLFITVDNEDNEETEIRILYETFSVSIYEGEITVDPYDQHDLATMLDCHRLCSTWEEQPCSW